ncbi:RagB/SusD family nutrient uptake outer membrane protein [Flagellimonas crocea]|uniref:RagB/SusD family nutrient uptake outer membrane protein n=1 Tax=Flagellimonas crocea TaxID=3067311 RepID=UPI00296FB3AB|nr:RagB/SusD family nutrient uptake outer membrane protein [Muricauda sp. DH64]
MKNTKRLLFGTILVLMSVFGCTDELEVLPEDPNTFLVDDFYTTPESYLEGLAGVYGNLTLTGAEGPDNSNISGLDAGTSQYGRGLWSMQELTADEVIWSWENDPGTRELNRNTWSADNVIIRGFFGRAMTQVAFVNEYLRQTSEESLDARDVDQNTRDNIRAYRAEARFLRALAYFHMMDFFGRAGFITEDDPVGAYQSPEYSREELFSFIESELLEILPDMVDPLQNDYGRADKAAAWMLLAKIYLNAEVYTGEEKYVECLQYCEQIISSGYELSTEYLDVFKADNDTGSARNEIIFPVLSDGVVTQNYGPTTLMINGQVGSLEQNGLDFGVNAGGWGGALRVTRQFSELMLSGTYDADDRNTLIIGDRPIDANPINNNGTGYIIGKWSNLTSDEVPGSATEIVDTDFPMFRLGDVYLMYVEAHLRGGGGSLQTAVDYFNLLRTRADNPVLVTAGDLDLDLVLEERLVELHWEGHRRQDLIRFGQYTGGTYNWSWKGGAPNGIPIANYRDVFPIPNASLASNPNLNQNEGY